MLSRLLVYTELAGRKVLVRDLSRWEITYNLQQLGKRGCHSSWEIYNSERILVREGV